MHRPVELASIEAGQLLIVVFEVVALEDVAAFVLGPIEMASVVAALLQTVASGTVVAGVVAFGTAASWTAVSKIAVSKIAVSGTEVLMAAASRVAAFEDVEVSSSTVRA